jgi:hypothetical protein
LAKLDETFIFRISTGELLNDCDVCELSLDPEVATLFGREIGQSNGDILLTGDEPARIKVG